VTVVGAGPTGIETAAELAEQGRRVTLVCGGVLGSYLHTRGRRSVSKRLARLGVTVIDGSGAKATAVTRGSVRLADGRELPSEVTVWTVGLGVPDLAARSGLGTDAVGRLRTDETLTSVDDERVLAAGDSAAPSGLPLRMNVRGRTLIPARAERRPAGPSSFRLLWHRRGQAGGTVRGPGPREGDSRSPRRCWHGTAVAVSPGVPGCRRRSPGQ
jgi:NADPH-dependent 2,4-dienoyl-CoA reductase/sulfur reductase-like enzyme